MKEILRLPTPAETDPAGPRRVYELAKAKKAVKVFLAAGIMALGSDPLLDSKLAKGKNDPGIYLERIEQDEARQQELAKILDGLCEKYSVSIIGLLDEAHRISSAQEFEPRQFRVEGFEKIGLEDGKLKDLWEQTYPAGALKQVSTVDCIETDSSNVDEYNIKGNRSAGTTMLDKKISFYNKSEMHTDKLTLAQTIDWHFSHDLGHKNDWMESGDLSPAERMRFLQDATDAFLRKDSTRDPLGYIDSINNESPRKELYYKVKEYWATLCEFHLTFPEVELRDYENELLKKWLHRGVAFDNKGKQREREEILKRDIS